MSKRTSPLWACLANVCFTVETGSFDPSLGAFTPTKFLGSPNSSVCATGFDQLSYIEGVSSNLFNGFNTSVSSVVTMRRSYTERLWNGVPGGSPRGVFNRTHHRGFAASASTE